MAINNCYVLISISAFEYFWGRWLQYLLFHFFIWAIAYSFPCLGLFIWYLVAPSFSRSSGASASWSWLVSSYFYQYCFVFCTYRHFYYVYYNCLKTMKLFSCLLFLIFFCLSCFGSGFALRAIIHVNAVLYIDRICLFHHIVMFKYAVGLVALSPGFLLQAQ